MERERKQFRIGLVQENVQGNKNENLRRVEELIDCCARDGAELVITPENMNWCTSQEEWAESVPGYTTDRLAAKAKAHHIYLLIGSIREKNERGYFNTSVLIDREGGIAATYSKIHAFDVTLPNGEEMKESSEITPGTEIRTVDTDLGRIGLSICYDLRFPELYRLLALDGAQLLVVPANFAALTGKDHWEILLRARAIENGIYVAGCCSTGTRPDGFASYGNSMVVDPWGKVIARADESEGYIVCDIDYDYEREVRGKLPGLVNRRADVYNLSVL